jgi:folate-dependent phosphoribosylglycinamide formyltransferase PurN
MEEMKRYYVPKSSEGTDKVNLVLIASGSGTDADAIMKAWASACLPEVNPPILISTNKDAGCMTKADELGLRFFIFDRKDFMSLDHFNLAIKRALTQNYTDLVFLVGCVVKIYQIPVIDMYNIHPADTKKFGGQHMYGLKVHEYVLRDIKDQIYRRRKTENDKFFTYPTVHEVDEQYDSGNFLLRQAVEIPKKLVNDCVSRPNVIESYFASELQKVVLPYEWLMLPPAVRMAARRILERRKG